MEGNNYGIQIVNNDLIQNSISKHAFHEHRELLDVFTGIGVSAVSPTNKSRQ
jgi:hypothetical protein